MRTEHIKAHQFSHNLDLSSFFEIFGTSETATPDECRQLIAKLNSHYRILEDQERARICKRSGDK